MHVVHVMFSFRKYFSVRKYYSLFCPSVRARIHKLWFKQLQVTVILNVNKYWICQKREVNYFPTVSISLRNLVLLNWQTLTYGTSDGKLQKVDFLYHFADISQIWCLYFGNIFRPKRKRADKTFKHVCNIFSN